MIEVQNFVTPASFEIPRNQALIGDVGWGNVNTQPGTGVYVGFLLGYADEGLVQPYEADDGQIYIAGCHIGSTVPSVGSYLSTLMHSYSAFLGEWDVVALVYAPLNGIRSHSWRPAAWYPYRIIGIHRDDFFNFGFILGHKWIPDALVVV